MRGAWAWGEGAFTAPVLTGRGASAAQASLTWPSSLGVPLSVLWGLDEPCRMHLAGLAQVGLVIVTAGEGERHRKETGLGPGPPPPPPSPVGPPLWPSPGAFHTLPPRREGPP